MMIVDPPVNAFSPITEIQDWLEKLAAYPQDDPAVKSAIIEAQSYLDPDRFVNYAKDLLKELTAYPQDDPEVQVAIEDAKRDLSMAYQLYAKNHPQQKAA